MKVNKWVRAIITKRIRNIIYTHINVDQLISYILDKANFKTGISNISILAIIAFGISYFVRTYSVNSINDDFLISLICGDTDFPSSSLT